MKYSWFTNTVVLGLELAVKKAVTSVSSWLWEGKLSLWLFVKYPHVWELNFAVWPYCGCFQDLWSSECFQPIAEIFLPPFFSHWRATTLHKYGAKPIKPWSGFTKGRVRFTGSKPISICVSWHCTAQKAQMKWPEKGCWENKTRGDKIMYRVKVKQTLLWESEVFWSMKRTHGGRVEGGGGGNSWWMVSLCLSGVAGLLRWAVKKKVLPRELKAIMLPWTKS